MVQKNLESMRICDGGGVDNIEYNWRLMLPNSQYYPTLVRCELYAVGYKTTFIACIVAYEGDLLYPQVICTAPTIPDTS